KPLKPARNREQISQAAQSKRRRIGSSHGENGFDEASHLHHGFAVFVVSFSIEPRVARDFATRLGVIVHTPKVVAIRHRGERSIQRQNLHAMSWKIQLSNDLGT